MNVKFEELPGRSRVWVYQADRQLSEGELDDIQSRTEAFIAGWAAHSKPLKGSFKLFHQQFLVIAVDEGFNQASGCSIDSSVNFVKQLEEHLGISFFDRTKVAFLIDGKVEIAALDLIKQKVIDGKIETTTPTFNNLVASKQEFEEKWLDRAENTWLKRYF